ncbi:MAG: HAD family hydrolase [Opitutales bacterium]|nr:HAD family hydrolase [Opitutales bacterium]
MKKGFIFDFDGTIGETIPLALAALRAAYADLGLEPPSDAEIKALFGPNEFGLCKKLVPNAPEVAEKLYGRYLFHYEAMHGKYSPAPFYGIADALKIICDGGALAAIVTGKGDDSAKISLLQYVVGEFFDPIECGSEEGAVKVEKIKKVAAAWGGKVSKIYYIGDAVSDVYDALEAGAVPVSAAWSALADIPALKRAPTSRVFESVEDFKDWLFGEIL